MFKYGIFIITTLYFIYSGIIDIWISNKIEEYKKINNICIKNNVSSDKLLSTINKKSHIVENINDRKLWNSIFNKKSTVKMIPGTYQYLHRNYPNFEEKYAICRRYYTLHSFFLYIKAPGLLKIYDDGFTILIDRFCFFSLIHIIIQWFGDLENDKIIWKQTKIIFPWGIKKFNLNKMKEWNFIYQIDNITVFKIQNNDNNNDNKFIAYSLIS